MVAEVCAFVDAVSAAQEQEFMTDRNVVNYDETRVCVSCDGVLLLQQRGKERYSAHGQAPTPLGSLLSFVCADGSVICSFWILKSGEGDVEVDVIVPEARYPARGFQLRNIDSD